MQGKGNMKCLLGKRRDFFIYSLVALTLNFWGAALPAEACTSVFLNSRNYVVSGRNMDFDIEMNSDIVAVPAGHVVTMMKYPEGILIDKKTKYGFVGVNLLGRDVFSDGLNEKGLSVAMQWMEGSEYPEPARYPNREVIPLTYASEWILGNFANIAELRQALQKTIITGNYAGELKMIPPQHLIIGDETGESIVIEFVDGQMKIHDISAIKVVTNDPPYNWHINNLKKYNNYTNTTSNDDVVIYEDRRFVQAYLINKYVNEPQSLPSAIATATAIMNKVAVVRGEAKVEASAYAGLGSYNYTLWTVIRDHKNKVIYFYDADNPSLRSIDLKKLNLAEAAPVMRMKLAGGEFHSSAEYLLK